MTCSGGPRGCPGKHLGTQMLRLALAKIVQVRRTPCLNAPLPTPFQIRTSSDKAGVMPAAVGVLLQSETGGRPPHRFEQRSKQHRPEVCGVAGWGDPSRGQCLSLWFYCRRYCLYLLITAFPCGSTVEGTAFLADRHLSLWFYCQRHCLSLLIAASPCGSADSSPTRVCQKRQAAAAAEGSVRWLALAHCHQWS